MARLMVRCREVLQSAGYIDRLLADYVPGSLPAPDYAAPPAPDSLWSRGGAAKRATSC
jgi:Ni,Fe-hydrogenase III large subunit